MTPENYEKLKSEIVEACPELMELSFGCKFEYKENSYIFTSSTGMMTDLHQGTHSIFIAKRNGLADFRDYIRIDEDYKIRILGHPIRISHVLRAIDKCKEILTVDEDGRLRGDDDSIVRESIYWNLEQDDLALQSDEVKEFLFGLLLPDES